MEGSTEFGGPIPGEGSQQKYEVPVGTVPDSAPQIQRGEPKPASPVPGLPSDISLTLPDNIKAAQAAPKPTPSPKTEALKSERVEALPKKPHVSAPLNAHEEWVKGHPHVSKDKAHGFGGGCYFLDQTFAIVRHGDRLDHTKDWLHFPDKKRWPNDTPLTAEGHKHATDVGHALAEASVANGKPFQLIISSPYYRCAQTSSRIAEILQVPIHFDLDLGEVFDAESMTGNIAGQMQHREPEELKSQLRKDFPHVEYVSDDNGKFIVEGKLQHFPEPFAGARMRFCYKVKKLLQRASSELMSVVIVTHGDALAAVVGLLREAWSIKAVPYTAYAIASRQVKVMESSGHVLKEEPIYVDPQSWTLTLSKGFDYTEVRSEKRKQQAHRDHDQEMKQMNAKAKEIDTDYKLDPGHHENFSDALLRLGASPADMEHLLSTATKSHHIATENENRIMCSPRGQ